MRTLGYNLVVVPNNKLGQAIYTNYFLPEPRMIVFFRAIQMVVRSRLAYCEAPNAILRAFSRLVESGDS